MAPQPVEVVTVTVVSSSSSATSGPQVSSGSGSSSIPVAAIAGGTAGGVALAVILVLIWKYWGRVIKRTERQRRKEAQDVLAVRENTRRNASSGFRPQSEYRPMFTPNLDNRKVTFLARSPTRAQQNDTSPEMASPSAAADEPNRETEKAPGAPPGLDEMQQPSTSSSAAAPLLGAHEPEWRSESDNWQPPEQGKKTKSAPRRPPSPTPTPKRTRARMQARDPAPVTPAPPPTPPRSPQRAVFGSSIQPPLPSPTPSSHSPTPTSTPSPPSSSSGLRASFVTPTEGRNTPPVASAPPVSAVASSSSVPLAPPSAPPYARSWTRSPLRNSVLPASDDRPVIMPRAKNAPAPAEQLLATSPVSLRPSVPSLVSSASQYSAASGEPSVRRGFLDSLGRRHKSVVGTIASSARRASTLSSGSVYSNND